MQNQETIEGLIKCIDDVISRRDRDFSNLNAAFKNENGHIVTSEYACLLYTSDAADD